MKETIICAAIHYDDATEHSDQPQGIQFGFVIAGRRHSDCYKTIELLTGNEDIVRKIDRNHQGFLTNTNKYVGRKEAWNIAIAANQVVFGPTKTDEDSILISENLY